MNWKLVLLIVIGALLKLFFQWHFGFTLFVSLAFLLFLYNNRSSWLALQFFGIANWVTSLRLLILLALGLGDTIINPSYIYIPITIIPLLDVADGYIARKRKEESYFGMLYDMEVDALFVLLTSLIIFEKHPSMWIVLVPGFLRYLYKLSIDIFDPKSLFKESKQKYASYIAGNYFVAVIAFFILKNILASIYIVTSSILIILSFGRSYFKFFKWRNA